MKKRFIRIALWACLCFSFLLTRTSFAGSQWVLWSPGGEGSSEQAAPLLARWSEYLKQKGLDVQFQYLNQEFKESEARLQSIKPALAIVSLDAYLQLNQTNKVPLFAQTKMLPQGKGTQTFTIIQNKMIRVADKLLLTEPLSDIFVRRILLRDSKNYRELPLQYEPETVSALKRIGAEAPLTAILVNEYQADIIQRMTAPWATQLRAAAKTVELPSNPVVIFPQWKNDLNEEQARQALLGMEHDTLGQEILRELRLAGFMPADAAAYERLQELLKRAP